MNSTDLEIAALTLCALLIITPFVQWLVRRKFIGPELTVRVLPLEEETDLIGNSAGFEGVASTYRIIIRNNSKFAAYSPKIYFSKQFKGFAKMDPLNSFESIRSREARILDALFLDDKKEKESGTLTKRHPELENLKILIEYTNQARSRFYTVYDHKSKLTKQSKFRPFNF